MIDQEKDKQIEQAHKRYTCCFKKYWTSVHKLDERKIKRVNPPRSGTPKRARTIGD